MRKRLRTVGSIVYLVLLFAVLTLVTVEVTERGSDRDLLLWLLALLALLGRASGMAHFVERGSAPGVAPFQNLRLLASTRTRLERHGFRVLTHRRVPPNDGGISYGQAAVAAARLVA